MSQLKVLELHTAYDKCAVSSAGLQNVVKGLEEENQQLKVKSEGLNLKCKGLAAEVADLKQSLTESSPKLISQLESLIDEFIDDPKHEIPELDQSNPQFSLILNKLKKIKSKMSKGNVSHKVLDNNPRLSG